MALNTQHHIGGAYVGEGSETFEAQRAGSGEPLGPAFPEATEAVVDQACRTAEAAWGGYRDLALEDRAALLAAIADELDADAEPIVARAPLETGLAEARIRGELARATGQMRLFASVVRAGDFLGARIDTADASRQPMPKPDIRQYRAALGPVAVFGASNFPLAFSVAGGDTASALAAGCPVVVKAHPAHPGTSALVAAAIDRAVARSSAPAGVFSLVHGSSNAVGAALVQHPAIKAVGFTGSFGGGTALVQLAASRPEPIPVYAEMGSVNPLFLFPEALAGWGETIADGFVGSFIQGCGQFCTNPGIVFGSSGEALETFLGEVADRVTKASPGVMLHSGILAAYEAGVERLEQTRGISLVAAGEAGEHRARARLYRTTATALREQPYIFDEIFGPSSLLIEVESPSEFGAVAAALPGQLTAAVFGSMDELSHCHDLVTTLEGRAGRVLFNGFPTGVEVTHAMVHGGPFPATSDSRMTSVGTLAIERFLRPVCYQDCPDALLPASLKNANPLRLRRFVNGEWHSGAISDQGLY